MKSVPRLVKFLARNHQRLSPLLILTHDYPDPDALASAWALYYLATHQFGMRAKIAYGGIIGRHENKEMVRALKLPALRLRPHDFAVYPNVALVDTQPSFANNSFPKEEKASIVIDQHPSVLRPAAELVMIDTDSGATSALLAREFIIHGIPLPERLATALVYGILSDTLNLHRTHNPEVIEIYLALLPRCDIRALARIQNPPRSRKFFQGLATGLHRARIGRKLIISHLGPVDTPDLVSQMADFLLTCQGMQWSFCTGRYGEDLHVSLRTTRPNTSAGDVLRQIFDHFERAGGHGPIAGGRVRIKRKRAGFEWEKTESVLTDRLTKYLRVPRGHKFTPLIKAPSRTG
jgi:nanoRNase/pAp phosphatase (c-di-AMP/oligoRNAs hydrolase)